MHLLVFYEDICQNARSNHQESNEKFISLPKLPATVGILKLVYLATPAIGIDGSYANCRHQFVP
jgi:hypothetical protein